MTNALPDRQASFECPALIYHIVDKEAWLRAEKLGFYEHPSLALEGFIHCSLRAQLIPVANRYFRGHMKLVVLELDSSKFEAPLRYENTTGGTELFPHLYGRLNIDAVKALHSLSAEADGSFQNFSPQ